MQFWLAQKTGVGTKPDGGAARDPEPSAELPKGLRVGTGGVVESRL